MAGRLLTPPLAMAAFVFSQLGGGSATNRLSLERIIPGGMIILVSLYLTVSGPPKTSEVIRPNGIADEREFYEGATGLVNYIRDRKMPGHSWFLQGVDASLDAKAATGRCVVERDAIGMFGYAAGPNVYIVDVFALADPFLSRLPAEPGSRIGHFTRTLPEGYLESRKNSKNLLVDPELRALYDQIVLITQGRIFEKDRWRAIWKVNTGRYRNLVPRGDRPLTVSIESLAARKAERTPWNASGNFMMPDRGLIVELGKICFSRTMDISLDHNDTYQLEFGRDNKVVGKMILRGDPVGPSGLRVKRLALPQKVSKTGFDKIRIVPVEGDGLYSIGHLLLE